MTPRHTPPTSLGRPATLPRVRLTCRALAAMAVLVCVDCTLAQRTPASLPRRSETLTEIWMSGKDVAVVRRIPVERRVDPESDHEFARTMANLAEQRFKSDDQKTAGWLVDWAQKLSGGRIGANGLTADSHAVPISTSAVAPPLGQTNGAPVASRDTVEPAEYWPDSTADQPAAVDQQVDLAGVDAPADSPEAAPPISNSAMMPAADAADLAAEEPPTLARPQPLGPASLGERHVALADPPAAPPQLASVVAGRRDLPAAGNGHVFAPTFVALISFTSGFVFCVGLVALIAMTPRRQSRLDSNITAWNIAAPASAGQPSVEVEEAGAATRNHAQAARHSAAGPARPGDPPSLANEPPHAAHDETVELDKTSALLEDFFNSNVELLKQCA